MHIAIFDIGKTNKKLLVFDEQYQPVYEEKTQLEEITDEDGFACEDISALTQWAITSFENLLKEKKFDIRALNFAAYGASFVYLDESLEPIAPLYNYLKPFPSSLQEKFYNEYGGKQLVAIQTASPVLGSLNSGLQLYRLKHERPVVFKKIKWALHLPQYLSYIFSAALHSDITSIGCHSHLWNYHDHRYHNWVINEGIDTKLPPVRPCDLIAGYTKEGVPVGPGLHDSSAALVPYLYTVKEPFVLLSTGTWCISLNPFNYSPLTREELENDALCYLSCQGKPVKAASLFAGYVHEQQVRRLASHFGKPPGYYHSVALDAELINKFNPSGKEPRDNNRKAAVGPFAFGGRNLHDYSSYEEAYHQLMADIIEQQINSTRLVLTENVKQLFVDGGFSKNPIYMHFLSLAFPDRQIWTVSVAEATGLGAALIFHSNWNTITIPQAIVQLNLYKP